MFITKTKSKNTTTYYLVKSFQDPETKKISTKTMERLGTYEEIQKKIGYKNVDEWANIYAKKMTIHEKNKFNPKISITFNRNKKIDQNKNFLKNGGYLYIRQAAKELELDNICNVIRQKENLKYNLYEIFIEIICNKILAIEENNSTWEFTQRLINRPKYTKEQIYEAQNVLAKHHLYIQRKFYNNIIKKIKHDPTILFYECKNYANINKHIIDITKSIDLKNDLIFTKIYFDGNGFPVVFNIDSKQHKNYADYKTINTFLKRNFKRTTLYICPESIKTLSDKKLYTLYRKHKKLSFQEVSSFDNKLLEWTFNPKGWHLLNTSKTYNLEEVAEMYKDESGKLNDVMLNGYIFFKRKKIKISIPNSKKNIYQNLILIYNIELKEWQKKLRDTQILNLQRTLETKINANKINNSIDRYSKLLQTDIIKTDEEDSLLYYFDDKSLRKDEIFDGYYAICENSDRNIMNEVIKVMDTKIERLSYILNSIKSDYDPIINKSSFDNLFSHYLTSIISLSLFKYIEFKLKHKYSPTDLLNTLINMNLLKISDSGWIPTFSPSELTEELGKKFNIDLNYEFISSYDMNKYLQTL